MLNRHLTLFSSRTLPLLVSRGTSVVAARLAPTVRFHDSAPAFARAGRGSRASANTPDGITEAVVQSVESQSVENNEDDVASRRSDSATNTNTSTPAARGRRSRVRARPLSDSTVDEEMVTLTREQAEALGLFEEEERAAAAAGVKEKEVEEERKEGVAEEAPVAAPTPTTTANTAPLPDLPDVIRSTKYMGVLKEGPGAVLWESVIVVNGREVSGGEYEIEEEAARAYDALARMYQGAEAKTNFAADPYKAWMPPEAVATAGQIVTKLGAPLTVEEIVGALEEERGVNVRVVPLAGRSDFAEALIFVTGRSVPHMRKMADMIARALRKRRLPGLDASVEARESDDWMLVDCGNIIVSVMDAEAREVFDLEKFWEGMELGKDPYEGMTFDEWLDKNPVPDKWVQRLAKDDAEMVAAKRVDAAPPQASGISAATAAAGGRAGVVVGGHHFRAKLKGDKGARGKEGSRRG